MTNNKTHLIIIKINPYEKSWNITGDSIIRHVSGRFRTKQLADNGQHHLQKQIDGLKQGKE